MKRSKAIGLATAVLFAALWALPLVRAVSFFRWAQDYFRETGSINASNDLEFSSELLGSYLVSLLAALAFAWILSRCPRFRLFLPGVLLVFAVVLVLLFRPESPIVLFSIFPPRLPAILSIVALSMAVLLSYIPRNTERKA